MVICFEIYLFSKIKKKIQAKPWVSMGFKVKLKEALVPKYCMTSERFLTVQNKYCHL